MSKSLNIPLTDELKKFISSQVGEGTFFSTPSEYVRNLIRQEHERLESEDLRMSIIEGYQDAINKRVIKFSGNLNDDLEKYKTRSK